MEQWEYEEQRIEFIKDFYYKKLNCCGCGSPWNILYTIRLVLNTLNKRQNNWNKEDYNKNHSYYYNLYEKEIQLSLNLKDENEDLDDFSINEGVKEIVLNLLNNCEVLEHGSGIGGSWLTEYGKELLKYLNELTDDELEILI